MTTKAILGNNFLRDQESNIDMKLGVLTINDETHLLQIERAATCCRVRLTDSVEILPQHEMCLTGILDRPGKDTVPRDGTVLPIPEDGPCENPVEHLMPLLDGMSDQLEPEQQERVLDLVLKYQGIFALPNGELGHTTLVQHTVDTGDSRPIKQPPRRMPLPQREIADREVDKMLEKGYIEPSDSPWASPIVLVTKKDGSTRFCIDYRRLNDVTRKDAYPLPHINETIKTLSGAGWFSTLDLASGYWQVSVAPEDRPKTAFTTRKGLFQWRVMPFGLSNAPATFSRLMELVLRGLNWEHCMVYLDIPKKAQEMCFISAQCQVPWALKRAYLVIQTKYPVSKSGKYQYA